MSTSASPSHQHGDSSTTTDASSTLAFLPPTVNCPSEGALFDAMISKVVNDTVFPKKQFIILDRELDSNSKLAVKVMEALNMEREKWYDIREKIRKKLNKKRNNAQQCVRKSLTSKLFGVCKTTTKKSHASFPSLQGVLNRKKWLCSVWRGY